MFAIVIHKCSEICLIFIFGDKNLDEDFSGLKSALRFFEHILIDDVVHSP